MSAIKLYLTLCRVRIAFFAACSAAAGYFAAATDRSPGALAPAAAVFLLACGASALNQVQERNIDMHMDRTRNRPLPAGKMSVRNAMLFSMSCLAVGSLLCGHCGGVSAIIAGLAAVVLYNGIYTPLKRVTAFAAVPGATVGMLPPAIGWIAAHGQPADFRIVSLCLILFLWQMPHFWLLLLHRGKEYEDAGLPSLTSKFTPGQLGRIVFAWIVAAAIAGLSLPLYGMIRTAQGFYLLIPPAAWLIWSSRSLTVPLVREHTPLLFTRINLYLFLFLSLVSLDGILSRL